MGPSDEVIVVGDGRQLYARGVLGLNDPRLRYYEFAGGRWGNPLRDYAVTHAIGDFLMFADDDDNYIPRAIGSIVRPALARNVSVPHVFRIPGAVTGTPPVPANIGGAMFVPPNDPSKLGRWDDPSAPPHACDYSFIRDTLQFYPEGAIFHDEYIYLVRPHVYGGLERQLQLQELFFAQRGVPSYAPAQA